MTNGGGQLRTSCLERGLGPAMALVTSALASSVAAENPITEMQGACHSNVGSVGQAASLLSTVGWQVGGDFARAIDARAMVIPYLSGRDEQDLRRKGLDYYLEEGLPQAAEEAVLSGFLTSPEGHTIMITHNGDHIMCPLAVHEYTLAVEISAYLPQEDFRNGNDPQMRWYYYRPETPPPGVSDPVMIHFDADDHDYTNINPVRPRDVDQVIVMTARIP